MRKHAEQPRLCDGCYATAISSAEVAPKTQVIFHSCPHNQVIAVGTMRAGVITCWKMEGPLTKTEAELVMRSIAANLSRTSLKAEAITRQ